MKTDIPYKSLHTLKSNSIETMSSEVDKTKDQTNIEIEEATPSSSNSDSDGDSIDTRNKVRLFSPYQAKLINKTIQSGVSGKELVIIIGQMGTGKTTKLMEYLKDTKKIIKPNNDRKTRVLSSKDVSKSPTANTLIIDDLISII